MTLTFGEKLRLDNFIYIDWARKLIHRFHYNYQDDDGDDDGDDDDDDDEVRNIMFTFV